MTVALYRQVYISRVNELLQDVDTYEVIERNSMRRMITDLRALLISWEKKYIANSTYRSLLSSDEILSKA